MMESVGTFLVTALLRVVIRTVTDETADAIIRKVLIKGIQFAVKSTHNSVDDELVAPLIKALKAPAIKASQIGV